MDLIVVAKEPVPGQVKTRLCPPCTPRDAAEVAAASLADTLEVAVRCAADRVVVALDGRPGPWCPPGVDIVDQGTGPFDRRLTTAWAAVEGRALQIGMDTPQITTDDIDHAFACLDEDGVDAVLGPALDGGWWSIGLLRPHPDAFVGVPMSRPDTGERQHDRLRALGLRTRWLEPRRDVDTWDDAVAVAASAPRTRFAAAVHHLTVGAEP